MSAIATPRSEATSWGFDEGAEIADGLSSVRLLGGGHRYEAYLAWDDRLYSLVVVKILRPTHATDDRPRGHLADEAAALAALQHPVLPRCFGSDLDSERPHIVLEFLEGPRLSTLLRRYGALALEQVLPLGLQVCSALRFMRTEGWTHLDVKPKNIVMGGPPKLIDLSVAARLDDAASITGPVGTDAYMAPEQCGVGDRGSIGPATDVWGLGVTLYEAIAKKLPFSEGTSGGSAHERFPQLVQSPRPLPDEIPHQVRDPIMASLQHDPSRRPTIEEIADELQRLAGALPTPSALLRLRPGSRRALR